MIVVGEDGKGFTLIVIVLELATEPDAAASDPNDQPGQRPALALPAREREQPRPAATRPHGPPARAVAPGGRAKSESPVRAHRNGRERSSRRTSVGVPQRLQNW